jgi:hypothetical protein
MERESTSDTRRAREGSDIKKGIDLYLENSPTTIATYDITHKMANLLKHELSDDKRFQEFLKECSLTRQRVQQTDLCFLSPPIQRAKSRYHNIDILNLFLGLRCSHA